MTVACLYPQTICLDNSSKPNTKLAFGILIGNLYVDLENNKVTNAIWGNINMDFQYCKKNNLNFDFENINYHYNIRDKTYSTAEEILKLTKCAIYQSLVFHSYGRNIPLDLYNNPNILLENGYLNNLDIFQLNNLENIVKSKTLEQFDFKQKIVDINTNYLTNIDYESILWVEYSLNINLLGETSTPGIRFLLGWKLHKTIPQPKPEPTPEPEPEPITQIILKLQNIKKITNGGIFDSQYIINSSHTCDADCPLKLTTDEVDFFVCGGNTASIEVHMDDANTKSLKFNIDKNSLLTIESNSDRAKSYHWINNYKNNHTFGSLIKGLFGEMLIQSNKFPVERTKSATRQNPYSSLITNESLTKCIDNANEYFSTIHDNIISGLEKYYTDLWNNDEYIANIINKNKRFYRDGDIIGIPFDINTRCAIKSVLNDIDFDISCRYIKDVWNIVFYFFVKEN